MLFGFAFSNLFLTSQTAAETDLLKVTEGNLEFQKVALNGIQKRLSDKMYGTHLH
jgi:hypothetical protein